MANYGRSEFTAGPWQNTGAYTAKVCNCGSGKERYPLSDARGIFCAYVCEDCESEVRKKYRVDVMEDPNYYCDEQIEEDY